MKTCSCGRRFSGGGQTVETWFDLSDNVSFIKFNQVIWIRLETTILASQNYVGHSCRMHCLDHRWFLTWKQTLFGPSPPSHHAIGSFRTADHDGNVNETNCRKQKEHVNMWNWHDLGVVVPHVRLQFLQFEVVVRTWASFWETTTVALQ